MASFSNKPKQTILETKSFQLWTNPPPEFKQWLSEYYPKTFDQIFGDDVEYEDLTPQLLRILVTRHRRWIKWGEGKIRKLITTKSIKKNVRHIGRFKITKVSAPSMIQEWRRLTRKKYRRKTKRKTRPRSKLSKVYTARRRKRRRKRYRNRNSRK